MSINRENLKALTGGAYDIQKLRIMTGNRIVQNFKIKLGQAPGKSEKELAAEAKLILARLRTSYKRIADGILDSPRRKKFTGDEVISDFTEYCLVRQYMGLEEEEKEHFKNIEKLLKDFPIWSEFLLKVHGVGPAMGAVIISTIDIYKAQYPSSIWAYAGLDVDFHWDLERIEYTGQCSTQQADIAEARIPKTQPFHKFKDETGQLVETPEGPRLVIYFDFEGVTGNARYLAGGTQKGRSRRKEHLREVEYISKDGEVKTKMGITFNPWLKTKLIGVLGSSFVKSPADKCQYRREYDVYKNRIQEDPRHAEKTKGHIHAMAVRFCVKRFLADLYAAWRVIEGLPVSDEYHVRKLSGKKEIA